MTISLYAFILDAYDETELLILCEDEKFQNDKSEKVISEFSETMAMKEKVRRLIGFCRRHALYKILWETVKETNKRKWESWQMPENEPDTPAGQARENFREVGGIFREIKAVETIGAKTISPETPGNQTHPLTQGETELKKWFSESLNPDEQVFLLTSALFSGLEKVEFLKIYDGVNVGLQATESEGKEK